MTAVIVGAVMGGLAVIIIIIAGLSYVFKRSNKVADSHEDNLDVLDVYDYDRDAHSVYYGDTKTNSDVDDSQTHCDVDDDEANNDSRLQKQQPVKRFT